MSLSYEQGLRMAKLMKEYDSEIRLAIRKVQLANFGVVLLKFTNDCTEMAIETLDEPYEENVRVSYS